MLTHRAISAALASVTVLFVAAACGSGGGVTPTCAQSDGECKCQSAPFTLESGSSPVASCDNLPAAEPWFCTYDLNSAGETTTCDCLPYGCNSCTAAVTTSTECTDGTEAGFCRGPLTTLYSQSAGSCACYVAVSGGSAEVGICEAVAACPATMEPGYSDSMTKAGPPLVKAVCCASTSSPQCSCSPASGGTTCPAGMTEVDNCTTSKPVVTPSAVAMTATSCEGLKWAAPPAPASSGAGGSAASGCPGGCGSCEQCVGNECHSCGYGVEGGCLCG